MATQCGDIVSKETQQLLDEAEERVGGLPEGIIERELPAIEVAMENKSVELLQQHAKDSQERINEARTLSTEGSREGKEEWEKKLEDLDHGKWPSDKESRETCRAGLELGIKEWSCASLPPITGLGVKDMQPHINETIKVLSQNEKLWEYRQLWTGAFANKIMFADRGALEKEGIEIPPGILAMTHGGGTLYGDKDLPSTILIFNDPITGEFPKGDALLHQLAHEIAHEHEVFNERQLEAGKKMEWFKPVALAEREVSKEIAPGEFVKIGLSRWDLAIDAQMKQPSEQKFVSDVAEATHKTGSDRHFVHEHFAAWIMNSPNLCNEMRKFFDEYMPK